MADLSAGRSLGTPARRLGKPQWTDIRLIVGLLLIAASVLAGASVINRLDESVEVYAANTALVPGEALSDTNLKAVKVRADDVAGKYFPVADGVPSGEIVRAVGEGEFLPRAALGATGQDVKAMVLQVDSTTARSVIAGETVDVWVADPVAETTDTFSEPRRVLENATVGHLPEAEDGALGINVVDDAAIQILVPDSLVPQVISAQNAGAKVSVVPTGNPAP